MGSWGRSYTKGASDGVLWRGVVVPIQRVLVMECCGEVGSFLYKEWSVTGRWGRSYTKGVSDGVLWEVGLF
jgi:hypothetical protein